MAQDDTSVVIKLRDAFTGGRVGPFSLKCDLDEVPGASEHFAIKFFDIVSLYPFTNFNCEVNLWFVYFVYLFLVVGLVSYWASEGDYLGRKG